ncbi:hypothetical protein KM043_014249 [Ampulex compressa]|nr:hypothetical protein KM043_014249 [Ampulex compressa]
MSGILSVLWVLLTIGVATTTVRAGLKCDAVRPYFEAQGFPPSDIPKEAISCWNRLQHVVTGRTARMECRKEPFHGEISRPWQPAARAPDLMVAIISYNF